MKDSTLIIGASTNPNRYSNIAIKRFRDKQLPVVAIGLTKGKVLDVIIDDKKTDFENIDTVTLYLNPKNQEQFYDYIIGLKPRRVIFNPGSENPAFENILKETNIEVEVACTLVMLSINEY